MHTNETLVSKVEKKEGLLNRFWFIGFKR